MNIFCKLKKRLARVTVLLLALLLSLPGGPGALAKTTSFPDRPDSATPDWQNSRFFNIFAVKEPIHLVLVEKSTQRLMVLRHDGRLRQVAQYTCATGENPGQKLQSGDSRTPEGIYFITKIFTDSKITVFGSRAFHLDYPNIYDKAAGRNGDGIYIHGTNKELAPNSTNGCITLKNKDLDDLVQYLDMLVTPVIIVDDIAALDRLPSKLDSDMADLEKTLVSDIQDLQNTRFDYLYLLNYGDQAISVGEYTRYLDETVRVQGYSRSYLEPTANNTLKIWERISKNLPALIYPGSPMKIASHILPPTAGKIVSETKYTVPALEITEPLASEPVEIAELAAETDSPPPLTSQIKIASVIPVQTKLSQADEPDRTLNRVANSQKKAAEKAAATKELVSKPAPETAKQPSGPLEATTPAPESPVVQLPPDSKPEPIKIAAAQEKTRVEKPAGPLPEPVKPLARTTKKAGLPELSGKRSIPAAGKQPAVSLEVAVPAPESPAVQLPSEPKPESVRIAGVQETMRVEKPAVPVKPLARTPARAETIKASVSKPLRATDQQPSAPPARAARESEAAWIQVPPEFEPPITTSLGQQPPAEKAGPAQDLKNRQAILDFLENWRRSWESKEIEPYIASYADSFRQGGMDLAAWRKHKNKLNSQYKYIKVDISNIKIDWTKAGATVSFRQEYRSDRYRATGTKTLHLKTQDKEWKIAREAWSKSR